MRKWPPLRFFVVAARDRHLPGITVLGCFLTSPPKEKLRDTGRIRRKNMLDKFVAREMEQRKSIEKRESLHEMIA